jgi:DNA polymerase III alpha subunit (gram-positive type)
MPSLAVPTQFMGMLFDTKLQQNQVYQPKITSQKADVFLRQTKPVLFGNTNPLQQKLEDATFIVIDTETTGFCGSTDRIIQISAQKYRNGRRIGKPFTTFVNPGEQKVPDAILELTKIQPSKFENAPTIAEVIPQLTAFLGDEPLIVAHNAPFDLRFLEAAYKETTQTGDGKEESTTSLYQALFSPARVFCTYALAQGVFTEKKRFIAKMNGETIWGYPSGALKLGALAKDFGIPTGGAHQADFDVEMCAFILYRIIDRLKKEGATTVQDLKDYLDALPNPYATHSPKIAVA